MGGIMIDIAEAEVDGLHPDGLTSLASAAKLYDVSPATLRRRWAKGLFPKPVKIPSETPDKAPNFFKNSDLIEYNKSLQYIDTETA